MVHRDIELSRLTGAPVHLLHLSTAGSVDLVRRGQAGRSAASPPRRRRTTSASPTSCWPGTTRCTRSTRRCERWPTSRRSRAGLADGTIDAIATDHAPHTPEAKEQPLDQAPPGMLGLETALGVCLDQLDMPLVDVVAALSWKPAAIAGRRRSSRAPDRPWRAGQPGGVRPARGVAGAAGATGEQEPQHAVRRASTCAAGFATRCSTACRSWSTGMAQR